jgi:hypothetical protein
MKLNMKTLTLLGLVLAVCGCEHSQRRVVMFGPDIVTPPIRIGEFYDAARERLILSGWIPIPAKCAPQNVCFDEPELATNMKTNENCAIFSKAKKELRVCASSMGYTDTMAVISAGFAR